MTKIRPASQFSRGHCRGFSLVEVLVSTVVGSMILVGVLAVTLFLVRSGIQMVQYSEMDVQIRRAVERLGSDLRIATGIEWRSSTEIVVTVPDVNGAMNTVTYVWNGANQSFSVVPGADASATAGRLKLLSNVPTKSDGSAGVEFSRFDKDGVAATTDASTKSIRVSITAARRSSALLAAVSANTSASFVLRNKGVGP